MNIRPVKESDIEFLFNLRNEPTVRHLSFNSDPIDFSTHKKWFQSKFTDKNTFIFICEEIDEKIGQIRYDLDLDKNSAEVSIAILDSKRNHGFGTELLKKGSRIILQQNKSLKLIAHIKPENLSSIRAFSKAGFKDKGFVNYKGNNCIEMIFDIGIKHSK